MLVKSPTATVQLVPLKPIQMKKNLPNSLTIILLGMLLASCDVSMKQEVIDEGYDPEGRLKELEITLPTPPQPVANYVNGVRAGNLIFLAGKGPKYPDGSELTGKLGQEVTIEQQRLLLPRPSFPITASPKTAQKKGRY